MIYACNGCGKDVPVAGVVDVWARTPLGVICFKAHPGCEETAVSSYREQPSKRIAEPVTKQQKAERDRERKTNDKRPAAVAPARGKDDVPARPDVRLAQGQARGQARVQGEREERHAALERDMPDARRGLGAVWG